MRIEVDTKHDSKEEIMAAIRLLQATLSSRSDIMTNSPELVSSSNVNDRQPAASGFSDFSASGYDKKPQSANFFDMPTSVVTDATAQGSQPTPAVGLADFFSSSESKASKDVEKATDAKPRTSFFKEFDDEEEQPKVKIIPY